MYCLIWFVESSHINSASSGRGQSQGWGHMHEATMNCCCEAKGKFSVTTVVTNNYKLHIYTWQKTVFWVCLFHTLLALNQKQYRTFLPQKSENSLSINFCQYLPKMVLFMDQFAPPLSELSKWESQPINLLCAPIWLSIINAEAISYIILVQCPG